MHYFPLNRCCHQVSKTENFLRLQDVVSRISKIKRPRNAAPYMVASDGDTKTLTVYHSCVPSSALAQSVRKGDLDADALASLKEDLRHYVGLLHDHGIAYSPWSEDIDVSRAVRGRTRPPGRSGSMECTASGAAEGTEER